MKLIDLVEGYHTINKQVYDIDLIILNEYEEYVDVSTKTTIKDYNAFVSNPAGIITDILRDITSTIITEHPNKNISIYSMDLKSTFNNLPWDPSLRSSYVGTGTSWKDVKGSILIGNINTLFDTGGRKIPLIVDNIEDGIQEYISNLNPINLPSEEECMTKIIKDHKLVSSVLRRKVDVRYISIEIGKTMRTNFQAESTAIVFINPSPDKTTQEDQFEETKGKLKKLLEPYSIELILAIW